MIDNMLGKVSMQKNVKDSKTMFIPATCKGCIQVRFYIQIFNIYSLTTFESKDKSFVVCQRRQIMFEYIYL